MAAVRSRAQIPVGSAQWINDENDQVAQFCLQEAEDFTFSARNEVEWLNEHMADIFSKTQKDITDCFKTPGKLRGKTPRTVRKRDPMEIRAVSYVPLWMGRGSQAIQPLTDIFSANTQPNNALLHRVSPSKPAATFHVATDSTAPTANKKPHKANTDSGYHGMPEDDMDTDDVPVIPQSSTDTNDTIEVFPKLSPQDQQPAIKSHQADRSTTDRSFHSAKEELTEKVTVESDQKEEVLASDAGTEPKPTTIKHPESSNHTDVHDTMEHKDIDSLDMDKDLDEDLVVDESRSPSQGSSPARPLARKSSLTFAPLPPRDLTTKKQHWCEGISGWTC